MFFLQKDSTALEENIFKVSNLNGIYNDLANLLGMDAVLLIHKNFRGQQISFPVELFSREYIKKQIVSEYDGRNVRALATKYGYSEKWIRKILKDHAAASDA